MRTGLIAYSEDTGLGNQSYQLYKHLKPDKVMLLDRSGSHEHTFYPERYDSKAMVVQSLPDMEEVDRFIKDLDLVLMIEVPPTNYLIYACKKQGVKTIIFPNFEFYPYFTDKNLMHPDALIAQSLWRMDEYLDPVVYIPMPIEPMPVKQPELPTRFLHIAGRPTNPDRNGTETFLNALKHVTAPITATVCCQVPGFLKQLARGLTLPNNVRLDLHTSSPSDWKLNYSGQHVLVMPRRFGGLCMPLNEAIGFGMPAIMPDIEPNNQWLPKEWLVPAVHTGERMKHIAIDIYSTEEEALGERINLWAADKAAYRVVNDQVATIAQNYSWDELKPKYLDVFEQVCGQ